MGITIERRGVRLLLVGLAVLGGLARGGLSRAEEAGGGPREPRLPVLLLGAARSTFSVGDREAADPQPLWSPRLGFTSTASRDIVTAFEFGLWADLRGGEWKDDGATLKRIPATAAPPAYTHQLQLLHLGVPAMLRLTLPSRPVTPYAKVGLAGSYLLRAREEVVETSTGRTVRGERSVLGRMNRLHLDALGGAGVRADLARLPITLEVLYLHGLTEVLKENRVESRPDLKSRSVQFFLGIGLRRAKAGRDSGEQ